MGLLGKTAAALDTLTGGTESKIQLDATLAATYSAGQLSYDSVSKTVLADTGFDGVRVNVGQEMQVRFFNDTGGPITNGTVINAAGVDATNDILKGTVADITSPATSSAIIGVATADVLDGEIGIATRYGEVRGLDTSLLATSGVLYAGIGGGFTQTFPLYPNRVVIIGSVIKSDADGIVFVDTQVFNRGTGSKSYSFTQANVGTGTYYSGGYYDAATTSVALSQASLTQPFGATASPHAAHAFIVCSGAGGSTGGISGVRVTGDSINDDGVQTIDDLEIILADVTTCGVNDYFESAKKWNGEVLFEVFTDTATAYNLTFNYGLAKYEDLGNLDFTITGIETVGTAGANDTAFTLDLLYHRATGWTYSAGAFVAGDGIIASMNTDMSPNDSLSINDEFAWKRTNLNQFIEGSASEGVMFKIYASKNNTVTSMDLHITGVVEQLVF
jgi:hypothetical protein